MSKLITKKKIKASRRGVTFSFNNRSENESLLTQFDIGQKYIVDIKNNKMVILPSDVGLQVSRKRNKDVIKPLFDIRNKEALDTFKDAEYLQVSIYDDKIVVEGYIGTSETLSNTTVPGDITSILNVKKISEVEISRKELDSGNLKSFIRGLQYPMKVVSLFSGAGILDKSFIESGFDVVFALELNKDATETYKANIGDHIVCGDVCEYPKDQIPYAKVIIGGPSCRPFSIERFNYGTEEGSIANHPDSKLVYEYIQWIKSVYSDYDIFVLENVPGFLKASNSEYINMIRSELSDFEITEGIVNDLEQGGYQKRNRAVILGSKIGKIELPKPLMQPNEYLTVGDALSKVDQTWPNYNDITISKPETINRMQYVPQGGNWKSIPEEYRTRAKHSNSYKRLAYNEPCITLVNYRKPTIIHPKEDRILSVSEAAALSGLEKDFVFRGKLISKQQQVGNCVPLNLGKAIAREVVKCIDRFIERTSKSSNVCSA